MVIFYSWQQTCACVYSMLYKVYLYAQLICVTICAISKYCVAVQHTACTYKVLPKSVQL